MPLIVRPRCCEQSDHEPETAATPSAHAAHNRAMSHRFAVLLSSSSQKTAEYPVIACYRTGAEAAARAPDSGRPAGDRRRARDEAHGRQRVGGPGRIRAGDRDQPQAVGMSGATVHNGRVATVPITSGASPRRKQEAPDPPAENTLSRRLHEVVGPPPQKHAHAVKTGKDATSRWSVAMISPRPRRSPRLRTAVEVRVVARAGSPRFRAAAGRGTRRGLAKLGRD